MFHYCEASLAPARASRSVVGPITTWFGCSVVSLNNSDDEMDGEIDGGMDKWQQEENDVPVKTDPSRRPLKNTPHRLSHSKKHLGTDRSANLPGTASLHRTLGRPKCHTVDEFGTFIPNTRQEVVASGRWPREARLRCFGCEHSDDPADLLGRLFCIDFADILTNVQISVKKTC